MENALDIMAESAETIAAANETITTPAQQPEGEDWQVEPDRETPQYIMDLIEEADKRGYRRGLEVARKEAVLGSRGMWARPEVPDDEPLDTGTGILRCIRPGVWDD